MFFRYNNDVKVPVGNVTLQGKLVLPLKSNGIVIFSHSSTHVSPRNAMIADYLQPNKFGTLLFDLLTPTEDQHYQNRFDIELLTRRLIGATKWLEEQPFIKGHPLGYFAAGTGSAAALKAAAYFREIGAVISRCGRPDLAADVLDMVETPTLLIVGSLDADGLRLNRETYTRLNGKKKLEIIQCASHQFEEYGMMEQICERSGAWLEQYLQSAVEAH